MMTNESLVMDMPGTIGGAKLVFPEDNNKASRFIVKLDVRFEFDVNANSLDSALEKAKYFQETMEHTWGDRSDDSVSWNDHYVVKEIVEREIDV
jgi:hypothetical protein